MIPVRNCETGADVREAAAQSDRWRKRMMALRPAVVRLAAPPEPLPLAPVETAPAPPAEEEDSPARTLIRDVIGVAAVHFGVSVPELIGDRRNQPLVLYRQITVFAALKASGRSLPYVGRVLGGRDHTTILALKRVIERKLAERDGAVAFDLIAIMSRLGVPFECDIPPVRRVPKQSPPAAPRPPHPGARMNWSKDDLALLERMYVTESRPLPQIAKALRRSEGAITTKTQRIGLYRRRGDQDDKAA